MEKPGQQISDLMTVAEAAAYLRSTVAKMYIQTCTSTRVLQEHPVPFFRVGKELRFRKSSLDAWMTTLEKTG